MLLSDISLSRFSALVLVLLHGVHYIPNLRSTRYKTCACTTSVHLSASESDDNENYDMEAYKEQIVLVKWKSAYKYRYISMNNYSQSDWCGMGKCYDIL